MLFDVPFYYMKYNDDLAFSEHEYLVINVFGPNNLNTLIILCPCTHPSMSTKDNFQICSRFV